MDIIGKIDQVLERYTKDSLLTAVRRVLIQARQEIASLEACVHLQTTRKNELVRALEGLVKRCDGDAVLLDGSNIDTRYEHAVLGHGEEDE